MLKPNNYKARASACPDSWVDDGAWRRRWRHTCRQRQNLWRARATHFYLLYNKLCPKTEHFTQNTTLRWLSFLSSHWDTLTPPRNYSCFRWFFSASQNEVELQKGFYHISFILFNETWDSTMFIVTDLPTRSCKSSECLCHVYLVLAAVIWLHLDDRAGTICLWTSYLTMLNGATII